jgi:hypothetical protein
MGQPGESTMSEEKKCGLCGEPLHLSPTDKRVHSHRTCVTNLQEKNEQLRKAICIYAREELYNMNFENDDEVIEYFLEFAKENE